jgi:hypothetical protein
MRCDGKLHEKNMTLLRGKSAAGAKTLQTYENAVSKGSTLLSYETITVLCLELFSILPICGFVEQ